MKRMLLLLLCIYFVFTIGFVFADDPTTTPVSTMSTSGASSDTSDTSDGGGSGIGEMLKGVGVDKEAVRAVSPVISKIARVVNFVTTIGVGIILLGVVPQFLIDIIAIQFPGTRSLFGVPEGVGQGGVAGMGGSAGLGGLGGSALYGFGSKYDTSFGGRDFGMQNTQAQAQAQVRGNRFLRVSDVCTHVLANPPVRLGKYMYLTMKNLIFIGIMLAIFTTTAFTGLGIKFGEYIITAVSNAM